MAPDTAPPGASLQWQGSLFAAADVLPDESFAGLSRRELAHGAWVDHAPGWLGGADTLFAELAERLEWQVREIPMYGQTVAQPRLSAWWPRGGEAAARFPVVEAMAERLGRRYGVSFDSIGANLYRDGRDSVALHGDRHARKPGDADVVVALVSLGAGRRFQLRPRTGGRSITYRLGSGDLLVMGGSCQRTWLHGVPKMAAAGARMSLTFR